MTKAWVARDPLPSKYVGEMLVRSACQPALAPLADGEPHAGTISSCHSRGCHDDLSAVVSDGPRFVVGRVSTFQPLSTAMSNDTRFRVGISGSYGGFNLGDEAILQVILAQLQQALPVDITVFSRDSQDTKRRHQVERVVNASGLSRRETHQIVADLDLFILGGGGILYDGDADMYLREVLLAHEANTPVMVCAISAGPLLDPALRGRVRNALNKPRSSPFVIDMPANFSRRSVSSVTSF